MPDWKAEISARLAGLRLAPSREAEILEELSQHIEDCYRDLIAGGATEAEATRAALAELSDSELLARELRRVERQEPDDPIVLGAGSRSIRLADLWRDVRYGLRGMRKSPIFTLVAVLTIAIGIGANVVVFSLVERILLSGLPYREPDRLVRLLQSSPEKGLNFWGISQANFARYRDQNHSFEAIAAYTNTGASLTGSDRAEYLQVTKASADFFKVFGVNPIQGRTFRSDEDTPGKNNVVVLSYGLWKRRFGGDLQIVGKSLVINDVSTEVIGVMPASFRFPRPDIDLWLPLALNPQAMHPFTHTAVARLKPDLAPASAAADTTAILWRAATDTPEMITQKSPPSPGAGLKTIVTPLKETIVGKIEKPLVILQIAVALVLLIACANVANLLLSRATRRTHEIALRVALGATPERIIRQLVTESLLLAVFGAIVGIGAAWLCLRTFSRVFAQAIPRIEETGISGRVLSVTIAMTILTGLLFGLVPAFRSYWLGMKVGMNEGQKASSGYANRRMNSTLVAIQLALSLVLLIGAGLMLKSFQRLMSVNPGFDADNVLTMSLQISGTKYTTPEKSLAFYQKLVADLRVLPGIKGAAVASAIPFTGGGSDGHIVEGKEPPGDAPQAEMRVVSPGYFPTMGMVLQQGRDFRDTDTESSPLVAVVDQALARQYWPNVGDAIGKRIRTLDPEWYTIIGVVSSTRDESLSAEVAPHLYLAFPQVHFAYGQQRRMYLVVNTDNPGGATSLIRDRVRSSDPDVPVFGVKTMTQVIGNRLDSQRLINFLLTVFSVVALLLAAIGTYGVMSVFVSSRTPEFAIRLALGAPPRSLLGSVLKQGLLLAGTGIAFGLLASWALTRAISSQLFEVSATDPIVFTGIPLVLILVALFASYSPARRAARTDPAVVLRSQ